MVFAQTPEEIQKLETMVFEKKPSIISIPIDISVDDIQNLINAGLPDLIYEDNSFTDNKNDGLKVKVWRKGNLIFTENRGGVLTYEVPLKVWAQKEISILGISQAPSTTFEVKVKFSSSFKINEAYQIETKTKGIGYTWITKPILKAGLVDIPIGMLIGNVITSNLSSFAEQIDTTIKKNFSLKPYVIDAWNKAKTPIKVSEEYNTWLRAEPIDVYITPFISVNTSLKATIGIKMFVETLVGTPKETPPASTNVPTLNTVISIPEQFEVQLLNVIEYEEANIIAKRMFIGEIFEFSNGKYKVKVDDLSIEKHDEKLAFLIKTSGSFNGNILVEGMPFYDAENARIALKEVNMNVKTKNLLHKTAAWFLEGVLERRVQKEFGMPVNEIIEYSKKSVNEAINSEFSKGIKMKGEILSVNPDQVLVTEKGILAVLNTKARVQLNVKGI